jgi:hypothetical protein
LDVARRSGRSSQSRKATASALCLLEWLRKIRDMI